MDKDGKGLTHKGDYFFGKFKNLTKNRHSNRICLLSFQFILWAPLDEPLRKAQVKKKKLSIILIITAILIISVVFFLEISEKEGSLFKSFLYNEKEADKRLKVATIAMQCDVDPEANRIKMVETIHDIKDEHSDIELIVFGETILGWYKKPPETREYHEEIAETIPGITTQLMSRLSLENEIYISFGMVERDDGKLYNSQVLIDPNGKVIAVQRKKNPKCKSFQPGDRSIMFVDINGVRTGIVICFDIQSTMTAREVFENEPDLIMVSNADWSNEWDTRNFGIGYLARRFNSWLVSSNRFGDEGDIHWDGHIEISNPVGDICCFKKSEEQYAYYDIGFDLDQSQIKKTVRKTYMKISLAYHIVKNLDIAVKYVKN